ncbi:cytochrome P450 4c3 [Caerostris darwini]|uniref:Cytochrome P450 4c3 n=1 Tax=Caerostris darwini TaxID=1538125 RepID=A0AAV4QH40_9ARAC|nr:cytochrome P450 4c3 [Caerostris darwini]
MFFEIVVCALIGITAVLAIWTLRRKKYSKFVPDNKYSVFQVLVDAVDSILFVTSGKKNALHLYIAKYFREKSEKSRPDSSQWKERRKLLAAGFHSSMLKRYVTVINEHAQKLVEFLHEEMGKKFTCVESPLSLCSLDIVCGELNDAANQIIKERKLMYMNGKIRDDSRRPKCLLDVLLKLHIEDQLLDEDGVRQEVDTFIAANIPVKSRKFSGYSVGGFQDELPERSQSKATKLLDY